VREVSPFGWRKAGCLLERPDQERGVAVAAFGGDVGERKVGGEHQPLRFGEAASGDFSADTVTKFRRKKPIEADAGNAHEGSELRGAEGTRQVPADEVDGREERRIVHGERVCRSAGHHAARRDVREGVFGFSSGHEPFELSRRLVADALVVMGDGRKGDCLVFADDSVVVHAENRDIVGDAQVDSLAGVEDVCGVVVVPGEDGERLRLVAEMGEEPDFHAPPVIDLVAREVRPEPAFEGLARPFLLKSPDPKVVRVVVTEGEEGCVSEVALGEMLRGEPSDGEVVASDAGDAHVRLILEEVDEGDALAARRLDEAPEARDVLDHHERTVAGPVARRIGAVLDANVPAALACETGDAPKPIRRIRVDENEHFAEIHRRKYSKSDSD